jgi:hypothetical protein
MACFQLRIPGTGEWVDGVWVPDDGYECTGTFNKLFTVTGQVNDWNEYTAPECTESWCRNIMSASSQLCN